jgi:hypothetical protein
MPKASGSIAITAWLQRSGHCILYVDTRVIPVHILEGFQQAKDLREEADYYNRWSQVGCEKLINLAEEFLGIARNTVLPK